MSSTVSDSDSDAGPVITSDIAPSTFTSDSNIEITAQPATITWRTPDGQDQYLSGLNFDLHYDVQSSKAFFKLRAAVALKSQHRSRKTAVFLFVYPERIRALALDDSPCTAEAKALGPETVCLHFELSRVSALVVPKESVAPRNQASGDLLDSLRAVVQQAAFSVYVKVPCRRLPRQRLLALCGAISRHELKSIAAHSNTSSLYAGAGGQIIEGDSLLRADGTAVSDGDESTIQPPMENLPSYDEVPPGPPLAVASGSHKRRRLSTDDAETAPRERLDRKFIEDICAHIINSRLGEIRQDVARQLEDLENRMINYIDEQLVLQRQEIIEDIGARTEDEYYGLKLDLQDYIHEEVEEVQGQILDRLGTASFTLQLNP